MATDAERRAPGLEVDPLAPRRDPEPAPRWAGPLAGLVGRRRSPCSRGCSIAALLDVSSPIDAVGSEFIDHTPKWLKDWAIEQFGTNDKLALRAGIWITLGLAALAGRDARPPPAVDRARRHRPVRRRRRASSPPAVPASRSARRSRRCSARSIGCWLIWFLIGIVRAGDGATRARRSAPAAPRGWDRRRFLVASGTAAAGAAVAAVATDRARAAPARPAPRRRTRLAAAGRHADRRRRRPSTRTSPTPCPARRHAGDHRGPRGRAAQPDHPVHHAERRLLPHRHRARRSRGSTSTRGRSTSAAWSSTPLSLSYDDLLKRPDDRADDHDRLRVERGRRRPDRQRGVAGRAASTTCSTRPASTRRPSRCS